MPKVTRVLHAPDIDMGKYKIRWVDSNTSQSIADISQISKLASSEPDHLKQIRSDREKKYGSPLINQAAIGKMFTGLLENHYQITLPHSIPGSLVALMMGVVKMNREAFATLPDNHDDIRNYLDISRECREKEAK